jgi:hypothetical protein
MVVAAGTATLSDPPRLGAGTCAKAEDNKGAVPAKVSASIDVPARNWRRLGLVNENRPSVRFAMVIGASGLLGAHMSQRQAAALVRNLSFTSYKLSDRRRRMQYPTRNRTASTKR